MTTGTSTPATVDPQALGEICRRFGVSWLALFGSTVRNEVAPDSDVDVLYELNPGQKMTYIQLEELADALSVLFEGRYIDLARPAQLHWYIRDRVLREARVLYEG